VVGCVGSGCMVRLLIRIRYERYRAWHCSLSFSVVFFWLYIALALFCGGSCIALHFSARRAFGVVLI